MLKITSKENPRLQNLSKLYASRRARREQNLFVLEGVRLVCDALEQGVSLREAFVTDEGIRRMGDRMQALSAACRDVFLLPEQLARRVGDTEHPQGVFAVCEGSLLLPALPERLGLGCLFLCSLQDPGNVGTLLRTAAAFSLPVLMTPDCPAPDSPKVLRAAMGVRRAYCVGDAAKTIAALHEKNIPVLAAALGQNSVPIDDVAVSSACVVLGNEGRGLPEEVLSLCDRSVILPIDAACESLNAAAAGAVFAWELSRAARGLRP